MRSNKYTNQEREEIKNKIQSYIEQGLHNKEISEKLGICKASVTRWIKVFDLNKNSHYRKPEYGEEINGWIFLEENIKKSKNGWRKTSSQIPAVWPRRFFVTLWLRPFLKTFSHWASSAGLNLCWCFGRGSYLASHWNG